MTVVRTILWKHLQQVHGGEATLPEDPNHPVLAKDFIDQLGALSRRDQRALAASYIHLWKRSFRSLAKQLRGRPEYAVRLFCHELYPFLTANRLAGRTVRVGPRDAVCHLEPGLPRAYQEGLLQAFMELTGATISLKQDPEGIHVRYQVPKADRAVRLARDLTLLRIPLLLTALAAAAIGFVYAGNWTWWSWLILPGALAVQSGANALQDLRAPRSGSLLPRDAPRWWLWFQLLGSEIVALGLGIVVSLHVGWHIWAFAGAGAAIGVIYPWLRDQGLGPFVAGFVYGPLMTMGAAYAAGAHGSWELFLISTPLGALSAALLFVDDLAEQPLDEAGGKRTLAVRLPRAQHFIGYASLVAVGIGFAAGIGWQSTWRLLFLLPLLFALPILARVRANINDHHGLAPARLATLALHQLTAILLLIAL